MLVHPQFDPVAVHLGPFNLGGLTIGPFAIRWYGLMYLLGFILFVVLGRKRASQMLLTGWHPRDIDDMLFYGVLGVILGGRLGYVLFYKPLYYLVHPLEIFQVWQGGMSFHGGFLGVLIGLWFYAQKRGRRWLDVTDFVAPLCPLGLAAGRLGNFINGELVGRVTSGGYGYTVERSIAYAYLPPEHDVGTAVEVDIFGRWIGGEVAREPLYDPDGDRVRG
jgi:phosphatidylglycerol:prolipoprotein diacylglycerol transferase